MSIADRLREIPSLTGAAPTFDLENLPGEPVALFHAWLEEALGRQVPEPHAVTLATVDANGVPDARTLILKDVDDRGWAFAGTASSPKGRQLAANPVAALDVYWQPLMRAVRARGEVVEASPAECEADLAARSEAARVAVAEGDWRLWRLCPTRVEFFQAATDRRHLRVVYTAESDGWSISVMRGEQAPSRTPAVDLGGSRHGSGACR
ncbi:pyridoxine/pyridoxamine 5'-phosphate oxidase [Enemella sp. A6]|uniref:pyridoxine/pyridoxamine 5'-phosphate oxidase n=1 Tax=Enemella sp. A6 TaxID=3440152 RepID=UPI003EBA921F